MSLPRPVAPALRDDVDERRVARMWRRIAERRTRPAVPPRAMIRIAALSAAMTLALVLAGKAAWQAAFEPAGSVATASAPLTLEGGGDIPTTEVSPGASPRVLRLSDASTIVVAEGARLEPLLSSPTQFAVAMRRGRAVFDVTPGGARRWVIEAGLASIEVVGTRFEVARTEDDLRVSVEHGVVVVRGARVPEGAQRLEAGDALTLSRDVAEPAAPAHEEPATQPADDVRASGTAGTATKPTSAWLKQAREGRFRDAYATLGPEGLRDAIRSSPSAAELLALADVARLSGHPAEAVAPLEALLRTHAASSHASLAAVTLGRIYLDALGKPAAAARAFERALALGAPKGLEEDIFVRLVEAHVRANERAAAAARADEYHRRYPNGRRSREVSRWLSAD